MNETISDLFAIRDDLISKDFANIDPDSLSRAILKISLLLARLGEQTAKASTQYTDAETKRKHEQAKEEIKFGGLTGVTGKPLASATAKAHALIAIKSLKDKENLYEGEYKTGKQVAEDLARIVMAVQSRMSLLKSENRNAGIGG